MKPILFVGHSADRTGAPIVLLNFLKWLKTNSSMPFEIVLQCGGELEAEYRQLAPVTVLSHGVGGLVGRRLRWLGADSVVDRFEWQILRRRFSPDRIGLIYSNTVSNGRLLRSLSYLRCPVISHVHELENVIRDRSIGLARFELTMAHTQQFIAISQAVCDNLVQAHHVAADQITLIPGFISVAAAGGIESSLARDALRRELGLPDQALIVGGAGKTSWRKGVDIFIELTRRVQQYLPDQPVFFVWLGGDDRGWRFYRWRRAIAAAEVSKAIKFLGVRTNALEYLAAYDVFVLTSREDPFPLVMLEAALAGKPVVCFAGAGGAPEFVEDDAGCVVPYLDANAMADVVVKLLRSSDLRRCLGEQAQYKVRVRHDIAVAAPKILETIMRFYQA